MGRSPKVTESLFTVGVSHRYEGGDSKEIEIQTIK